MKNLLVSVKNNTKNLLVTIKNDNDVDDVGVMLLIDDDDVDDVDDVGVMLLIDDVDDFELVMKKLKVLL